MKPPRIVRAEEDGEDSNGEPDSNQEESGLSLEELSQTYAQMIGQGVDPYHQAEPPPVLGVLDPAPEFDPIAEELVESDQCPITPLSILEAILFVGRADNEPIEAEEVASMMRGVRSMEIEQLVEELNEIYRRDNHALRIVVAGKGYKMQLAPECSSVSERFYGRVREIQLTQAAIDCLALVAYKPGITLDAIEELRGQPSGSILNQLVRRQLIEIRRSEPRPDDESGVEARENAKRARPKQYYPTSRMLELTGLSSLDELPLAEDFDR